MHDKIAALEILARLTGVLTRSGGQGRFAMLEESLEDRAARQAEARAKLEKLIEAKAQYIAEKKVAALLAAQAEAAASDADEGRGGGGGRRGKRCVIGARIVVC
jgi:hypothetical protein